MPTQHTTTPARNRASTHQFTANLASAADRQRIDDLRSEVKTRNAKNRKARSLGRFAPRDEKVRVRYALGRNNRYEGMYRGAQPQYIDVSPEHAAIAEVYVYHA